MNRGTLIIIVGIMMFCGVSLGASDAGAAVMSIAPQLETVALDGTFVVTVQVDSGREYINVVQGSVSYPTDMLEVVSVDAGASFLTMWITPPSVDADAGIISFLGGKPNGTLVADSPALRITFRALSLGTATVAVVESEAAIHLNDGIGTRAALTTVAAQYVVENPSPFALPITSVTHPQEDGWYDSTTFQVAWEPREGAFYSHIISDQLTAIPDGIADEPRTQATYESMGDGIYYFILSERLPNDDWTVVGIRRFQVDATSPLPIDAVVHRDEQSYSGRYVLSFNTYDSTSGVDLYEVVEGNQLVSPATSPYLLTDQSRRDDIVVRAFDRAGNAIETVIPPASTTRVTDAFDTNIVLVGGIVLGIAVIILLFAAVRRRSV